MEKFISIIKKIIVIAVLIFCVAIIVRIFILKSESVLSSVIPYDSAKQAYSENGGNITVKTHNIFDEISKEGFLGAYKLAYIEETKQLQFTVRYNDSIYNYTDYEKDLEFVFFLFNSESGEYILPSHVETGKRFMYNYRRLTYDNVEITDSISYYVYISPDENSASCFDNLPIHYNAQEFKQYKLSNKEKKAFES